MRKIQKISNINGIINKNFLEEVYNKHLSIKELDVLILKEDKTLEDKKQIIDGCLYSITKIAIKIYENNPLNFINYSFEDYLSDCYNVLVDFFYNDKYLKTITTNDASSCITNMCIYHIYSRMINLLSIKKSCNRNIIGTKEDYLLVCEKYRELQNINGKVDMETLYKSTGLHLNQFLDIMNDYFNIDLTYKENLDFYDVTLSTVEMREFKRDLLEKMNVLPNKYIEIIKEIYGIIDDEDCHNTIGETRSEIAKERNVTRQYVCGVEKKALVKVRKNIFNKNCVH